MRTASPTARANATSVAARTRIKAERARVSRGARRIEDNARPGVEALLLQGAKTLGAGSLAAKGLSRTLETAGKRSRRRRRARAARTPVLVAAAGTLVGVAAVGLASRSSSRASDHDRDGRERSVDKETLDASTFSAEDVEH